MRKCITITKEQIENERWTKKKYLHKEKMTKIQKAKKK